MQTVPKRFGPKPLQRAPNECMCACMPAAPRRAPAPPPRWTENFQISKLAPQITPVPRIDSGNGAIEAPMHFFNFSMILGVQNFSQACILRMHAKSCSHCTVHLQHALEFEVQTFFHCSCTPCTSMFCTLRVTHTTLVLTSMHCKIEYARA